MPRKTKDNIEKIEEKAVKKATRSKTSTAEKTSSKKTSSKKNSTKKTVDMEIASNEATTKKSSGKTTAKKTSSKKSTTETTAKKTASRKSTTRKTPSKEKSKKEIRSKSTIEILEYYDLPYRYNQTIVRILAQTPSTLFVYWDISDEDKEQYIKQYGEYFFNNTKPVLIIHNKTLNYSFEIDINDFANSWYLHVNDSNCDYQVELGRRPVNQYVQITNNYLYITNSNDYMTQNDHILFDKLSHLVYFRNVKTNETFLKDITNFTLLQKIGKFDIKKFYEKLYPNGVYDFERIHLGNPSSR